MKEVSGVLVKYQKTCLLCKRAPGENMENFWSIPCGGVEKNEDILDAAIREFKEETNLRLPKDSLIYISTILNQNKFKTIKSIMHIFGYHSNKEIIPNLNNAKDGFEHTECRYFGLNEIDEIKITSKLKDIIKKTLSN
jgi:ADP-ribose pyrophosphatase YjhB (NUDIX family)